MFSISIRYVADVGSLFEMIYRGCVLGKYPFLLLGGYDVEEAKAFYREIDVF